MQFPTWYFFFETPGICSKWNIFEHAWCLFSDSSASLPTNFDNECDVTLHCVCETWTIGFNFVYSVWVSWLKNVVTGNEWYYFHSQSWNRVSTKLQIKSWYHRTLLNCFTSMSIVVLGTVTIFSRTNLCTRFVCTITWFLFKHNSVSSGTCIQKASSTMNFCI